MKPDDKTRAKTQTGPDARPHPDSQVRPHRETQDERQDRSRREFEADPVIELVIRTVVRNVTETVRRKVENNIQDAVFGIVTDYVSRNLLEFDDKALVRTIDSRVGNETAESEDEFGPELEDRFVVRSVSRQVVDFFVRTWAVVLTFV